MSVLRRLDWSLLLAVLLLTALGLVLVASATAGSGTGAGGAYDHGQGTRAYLVRQLGAVVMGGLCTGLVVWLGQRRLRLTVPVCYAGSLVLLTLVLLVGVPVNGVRGWLSLPLGIQLQPAELSKVTLVLTIAALCAARARTTGNAPGPADAALVVLCALLPVGLVLAEPDLGSALIMVLIAAAMLVVSGVAARVLVFLVLCVATVAAVAVVSGLLADYQIDRFRAFLDPEHDPDGAGYNALAAREAISAGGLLGAGLFRGARTAGSFVPEQHTDFVFTVAGEELGFIGSAGLVLLLAFVVWRAIRIARSASDEFGRLAAAGIASWLAVQSFENIGMTIGLTPITGVPLPFVSYGGSSIIASFLAVGVLAAIRMESSRFPEYSR